MGITNFFGDAQTNFWSFFIQYFFNNNKISYQSQFMHHITWISLKRGFDRCNRFCGCNGFGGFGGFDRFNGFSVFGGFDG